MTHKVVTMLSARDVEDNKGAPFLGVTIPERTCQVTGHCTVVYRASTSTGTPKPAQMADIQRRYGNERAKIEPLLTPRAGGP